MITKHGDIEHLPSKAETPGYPSDLGAMSLNALMYEYERPSSTKDIETRGGQSLKCATFYDGDRHFANITKAVVEARTKKYVQSGIWKSVEGEDAARGSAVEFMVMGEMLDKPKASLRKIHTGDGGNVQELFSVKKCLEVQSLDEGAEEYLNKLAGEREVVEIAALYSEAGQDVTDALFGQGIADSIKRGEVWVMGAIAPLYRNLLSNYGERVVEKIGKATQVNDGRAERAVRIIPMVVRPQELPVHMLQDIDEALAAGDETLARRREGKLAAIVEQFDFKLEDYFTDEVAARIRNIKESKAANPYASQESKWGEDEVKRLQTMDTLQASVAEEDMTPVLEKYRGGVVLDIGAGTGITMSELAQSHDATYISLDVNQAILDQRPENERKILASSSDIPLEDHSVDVSYSKAVTAWSDEPQRAIAEQLRVTKGGGVAVFTEFDWSEAGTGEHSSPQEAQYLARLKQTMVGVLQKSGFKPFYGKDLRRDIAAVVDAEGIECHVEETNHDFPEGDHRSLLLGAAFGLANLAEMRGLMTDEEIKSFQADIQAIEALPTASFVVPRLVTQKVYLNL